MLKKVPHLILIASVVLVGLSLCAPLQAGTVTVTAQSLSHVTDTYGIAYTDSPPEVIITLTTPPTPAIPPTATSSNNAQSTFSGGTAIGSETATVGKLSASSSSYYPATDLTHLIAGYATSENTATFSDTKTAPSTTTLTLTLVLQGTYTPLSSVTAPPGAFAAEAVATFIIYDDTLGTKVTINFDSTPNQGSLPYTDSKTIAINGGDKIRINGSIDALTYITGDVTGTRTAVVNLADTAQFYIDQSNGTPFIGDSGYDYSSPVPIPGTAYLLGSGLLGLIGLRRKIIG
jgi:hypothetical protein